MNEKEEEIIEYIAKVLNKFGYAEADSSEGNIKNIFGEYPSISKFVFNYTGNNRKLMNSVIVIYCPQNILHADDCRADLAIRKKIGENSFYTNMSMIELFNRLERITGIEWEFIDKFWE